MQEAEHPESTVAIARGRDEMDCEAALNAIVISESSEVEEQLASEELWLINALCLSLSECTMPSPAVAPNGAQLPKKGRETPVTLGASVAFGKAGAETRPWGGTD